MTLDRRDFLRLIGVASIAYPIGVLAASEPAPRASVAAASTALPLFRPFKVTAAFLDETGKRISTHYVIPTDWWRITDGMAKLSGPIAPSILPREAHKLALYCGEQFLCAADVPFAPGTYIPDYVSLHLHAKVMLS